MFITHGHIVKFEILDALKTAMQFWIIKVIGIMCCVLTKTLICYETKILCISLNTS